MTDVAVQTIGVVIIGRNEGQRLVRCIKSVRASSVAVVYVDSNSTDGSCQKAAELGADVVELDLSVPFTAARARNTGLSRLRAISACEFVQFIDGDCQLSDGWLEAASECLMGDSKLAAVAGAVKEIRPEESMFNRLCDLEWRRPSGECSSVGGISMMRISALEQVGGFNEQVIAGEEPELCFRLRQAGWKIRRIDAPMTLHDADMHRFSQWWKRAVRSGHAYAEAAARHGQSAERFGVRPSMSIWIWAAVVPVILIVLGWATGGWALLGFAIYPLQMLKISYARRKSHGDRWSDSLLWGVNCVMAKWPQWWGQVRYLLSAWRGGPRRIIEYKDSSKPNRNMRPVRTSSSE